MSVPISERLLPHNLEAERSILGSVLLHADVLSMASGVIQPEDFFREAHRRIYESMLALSEKRSAVDFVTIKAHLAAADSLDFVGGPAYIAGLVDGVPRSMNVEHYARIVRDKAQLRALIFAATEVMAQAYDESIEPADVLSAAESAMFAIGARRSEGELVDGTTLAREGYAVLERLHGQTLAGISTGLVELDRCTLGLHKQHLVIVAARPGRGKSAFALHLARHLGMTLATTVAVFSLEMSREELILRMLSSEAPVDGHALRGGRINEEAYTRVGRALQKVADSKIWVDDTPNRTMAQIRSMSRRLKARTGSLGVIVIDYLQLMTPERRREQSREQEVSTMAWGCKMLAKELDAPVVLLSQLNRASEDRPNGRPQLRDLRESGSLEQHADDVWFVHPPPEANGTCELIIGKQRNGPSSVIQVGYNPAEFRFWNLARV